MYKDLVCFSHLRWDFVFQRPQHLMTRFACSHRVFFIEEPVFGAPFDFYHIRFDAETNVRIVVPHFTSNLSAEEAIKRQRIMLDELLDLAEVSDYVTWYYTPMALLFSDHLRPLATVYDCMDELSGFKFASPALSSLEQELFGISDVAFTGGVSLYDSKKRHHHNMYPFPSSIDKNHFLSARNLHEEPHDQAHIPHPRLGFFGVIDERFDQELIREVSAKRPDLHFVLIGPVVKIDPEGLPRADNIHYLGSKNYRDLPRYLSGWDVAIMPFARNESTRFISPTKTPEYLAGGRPVISTSIHDVVNPYGKKGLVYIADTADEFINAADRILNRGHIAYLEWLCDVDEFIESMSWDHTFDQMDAHICNAIATKSPYQNPQRHV